MEPASPRLGALAAAIGAVALGIALALAAPVAGAEQPAADAGPNPGHEGYALYQRLCSECHGVGADGSGPRAPQLQPRPPDLTRLRGPDGRPPRLEDLVGVIDGRRTLRAHGQGPMPIWGDELVADVPDLEMREQARIRLVHSLAEYVLSIQRAQ